MDTKLQPAEDGKFHCDQPGCEQLPGYDLPQHLGLHKFHKHGIKGASRNPDGTPRHSGGSRPRGRPPKVRPAMLSAEDICTAALEAIAPNGSLPINMIGDFNDWVRYTEAFIGKLLG